MFKNLLVLSLLGLTLVSCGKDGLNGVDGLSTNGTNGTNGVDGDLAIFNKTQSIYSKYRNSIYRLSAQCIESNGTITTKQFGSGFRISPTEIATNKHVVTYACNVGSIKRVRMESVHSNIDTLQNSDNYNGNGGCSSYSVTDKTCSVSSTISISNNYDLAKITIQSSDLSGEPVKIKNTSYYGIKTGSVVVSMSFPLAFADLYTQPGYVTSNYIGTCYDGSSYGCPANSYDFIADINTDHGSSGSPVFDLNTQEVVGVVTAGTDGENMNTTWLIDSFYLKSIF